jgi:hypothetical protein
MSCYALVCAGQSDAGGAMEARQVFEKLLLLLLTERFWPHGQDALDPASLAAGDRVLFCLATPHGPELIGDAVAASASAPLTEPELAECRLYLGPAMAPGPATLTHAVTLETITVWDEPFVATDGDGAAAFELARALAGLYQTGSVRRVSETAHQWAIARRDGVAPAPVVSDPAPPPAWPSPAPPAPVAPSFAGPARPAEAGSVRQLLAAHWDLVDFGERLERVDGTGRSSGIATPVGSIDFACQSATGDLVAVICANGEPPEQLASSVAHRLAWARQYLAHPGQSVRGMLVLTDPRARWTVPAPPGVDVRRLQLACPRAETALVPGPPVAPPGDVAD